MIKTDRYSVSLSALFGAVSVLLQLRPCTASPLSGLQGVLLPASNGTRGAVACESSICSQIGAAVIKKGGSAADAMVATTLCVGTVAMYHSGIGGGGFMLVRDPKGQYEVIDYRETAPADSYPEMYKDNATASTIGGLAVAVPGELKGLQYLHQKYGVRLDSWLETGLLTDIGTETVLDGCSQACHLARSIWI